MSWLAIRPSTHKFTEISHFKSEALFESEIRLPGAPSEFSRARAASALPMLGRCWGPLVPGAVEVEC